MGFLEDLVAKARGCITDALDFGLVVAGAGSSVAITDLVRAYLPEQTKDLTDETIQAGIGFALFYWGDKVHPRVPPFGFGVLLAGLGSWSSEFLTTAFTWLKPK